MPETIKHFAVYLRNSGNFLCAYDAFAMIEDKNIAINRVNDPEELIQFEFDINSGKAKAKRAVCINEEWSLVDAPDQIGDAHNILLEQIRTLRNLKITRSDWTQLSDVPLTNEEKTLWVNYRQALRDIPSVVNLNIIHHISQVTWPIEPS